MDEGAIALSLVALTDSELGSVRARSTAGGEDVPRAKNLGFRGQRAWVYGLPEAGAWPPQTHNLGVDPKLDPATLRPQRGSPAMRPAGKGVDRGAYEQ
jgi:hypothetical protein